LKNIPNVKNTVWFTITAIVILAAGSIPNWMGAAAETDEMIFRGIYFDTTDYAANIAMMHAGEMGDWAYQMRFTNEPHPAAFLRMFHIILGHAGSLLGLDAEIMFQLARWLLGITALYSIYRLCGKIFPEESHARSAFLLASLGAGLGWLQLMLGAPLEPISPIDFWLIDAYVYFSLSLFPAFAYTLTLMVVALILYLDYLTHQEWSTIGIICALAIACQITNPIAFSVIDIAFVGATFFHWRQNHKVVKNHIYALALIAISQVPLLVYSYNVLINDPVWFQYTAQNETLSPPPIFYFWGFAPFWPFAIIGAIHAARNRTSASGALLGWTLSAFALAYLPVAIQRRFLLGITIPLGILAILGIKILMDRAAEKMPRVQKYAGLILFAYVAMASISSVYLSLGSSLFLQNLPPKNFFSADLEDALIWLDQHAEPNDFVLSSAESGQLVGQYTHLKAYIGHEMETVNYLSKNAEVTAFFQGKSEPGWLEGTSARWIIFGSLERTLAGREDFPYPDMEIAYQSEGVTIYQLDK